MSEGNSYADAVMKADPVDTDTKGDDELSELVVLSMNRKGRRGVAKANGGARIVGSNSPFLKTVID